MHDAGRSKMISRRSFFRGGIAAAGLADTDHRVRMNFFDLRGNDPQRFVADNRDLKRNDLMAADGRRQFSDCFQSRIDGFTAKWFKTSNEYFHNMHYIIPISHR